MDSGLQRALLSHTEALRDTHGPACLRPQGVALRGGYCYDLICLGLGPVPSSIFSWTLFMLWGAPLTVHFILERMQCLQLRALPSGGHSQVRAALAQLSQAGLDPDGLLARFFPCEHG